MAPWRKLLLVEGPDDVALCRALLDAERRTDVYVKHVEGKSRFAIELASLVAASLKTEGFSDVDTVAVVRDADDDAAGSFQSASDALDRAGLPRPRKPGEVARGTPRSSAVFVVPTSGAGSIEHLVLAALEEKHPDMAACARQFWGCLAVKPKGEAKSRLQIQLAALDSDATSVRLAVLRSVVPLDSACFDSMRRFLGGL